MNLDGIIEDYPNTTSPLNKAAFTNLVNAILDKICPVGKTEIFYDNEDHSDYLGFTWERTSVGRTLVGIDETQEEFDTIGKTGGHKLLQKHTHKNNASIQVSGGTGDYYVPNLSSGAAYDIITVEETGGGNAQNLQPYEVFAIWTRVA